MKYIREFNESPELNPTVGEVYNFFYGIIEDFCDHKNEDFKFQIHCNDYYQIRENEDIKWVSFYIESRTKFTSEDIYPVVKILFDWSKENGSNLLGIELRDDPFLCCPIIKIFNKNKTKMTHVTGYDGGRWQYYTTFSW